jgi:VCBS repeat protein
MCFLHPACLSGGYATLHRWLKAFASRSHSVQQFSRVRHPRHRVCLWSAAATLSLAGSFATAQTAFTDVTNSSGLAHVSETYGASWGDVNGDGFPDLFVSDHRTTKSLYQNKGNGTFTDIAPTINNFANRPGADTHGASWADFDNNGTQDLLVTIGTGNPSEWYVNKNGKLSFETIGSGFDVSNLGGRKAI